MAYDSSQRERATDLGMVRIHNDVISAVASIAANEIKGVIKMGGGFGRGLYELITKKSSTKGVRITSSNNEVQLGVSIIVEYGVDIPHVADNVQENVKVAVEKMTGLTISGVDVDVEGVQAAPSSGNQKR